MGYNYCRPYGGGILMRGVYLNTRVLTKWLTTQPGRSRLQADVLSCNVAIDVCQKCLKLLGRKWMKQKIELKDLCPKKSGFGSVKWLFVRLVGDFFTDSSMVNRSLLNHHLGEYFSFFPTTEQASLRWVMAKNKSDEPSMDSLSLSLSFCP